MGEAKRKKQRDCPVKGIITPEECGRGRNSTISCPLDCVYNPFAPANYRGQFLDLETKVIHRLSQKLAGALSPSQLREMAAAMDEDDVFTCHALHMWHVHGTGLLKRWEAEGYLRDWKNDERVMLRCFETVRPALIEIHEVIDHISCRAVDLLRPKLPPFAVIDSAIAARVGRYQVLLGWLYELPAGHRLSGGAIPLPEIDLLPPREVFDTLLDHLGTPAGDRQAWLMEHMPLLSEAFTSISLARQEKQLRLSDLRRFSLRHAVTKETLQPLVAALEEHPRILVEKSAGSPPRLTGAVLADEEERGDSVKVLGQLRVEAGRLEFQGYGERGANGARDVIASLGLPLGPEQVTVEEPPVDALPTSHDPDLVPASFLDNVAPLDVSAAVRTGGDSPESTDPLAQNYRTFADEPVPALGGKSPREAAADEALRPRLIQLMKNHVASCDVQRRTRGVDFDLNPVLRELGLDELILPPPPLGIVDDEDVVDDIPLDPPPPQETLRGEELDARIEQATDDEALWNRLEIRLADVLDAFNDLSDPLNAHELEAVQTVVLIALGALHPDQVPGYDPDPVRMLERYETWIRSGDGEETLDDYLTRMFAETRQPVLCDTAADLLFSLDERDGKKFRKKKLDSLFTALAAAIWEAAHWPPVLK